MPFQRLCLIVESGTDVRLVDGLCERFELSIIARRIEGGVEINHQPSQPVHTLVGPSSRLRFGFFVWKHLRKHREQTEQVVVQGYGLAALAANFAGLIFRRKTTMLVCSPAEAYYRCRKDHAEEGKPYRRRELLLIRLVARLNASIGQRYIVLSHHLAQVVRSYGRKVSVAVIPVYGVDTNLFQPPRESKSAIRERLGLPTTGRLIFFSSRIAPEKDSETLLSAVALLRSTGKDIWLLHRSGGYRAFIKDAERFGIADRIIASDAVHPHRSLPQEYQACDLCVQASREEGLGFSPLEALACGVPVVAAAVGGLKETIIDGQTGWTYAPGDSAELAACIKAALDDPEEAARRSTAGRELVSAEYDRQHVFAMLERAMIASDNDIATSAFVTVNGLQDGALLPSAREGVNR
ncbi:MAG TPA: glycosyltransferase family 4 protein [Pyrinomonadaceae bacterium]|nr:glycosyltransferase family 4 protein [Pyrinomonadaceae bacterium]